VVDNDRDEAERACDVCCRSAVDELSHTLHECDVEKLVGDFVQQFHLK